MIAPREFQVVSATRASRVGGCAAALLVAFLATFPFWADAGWMRDFDELACYLVFAMSWNLLAGYAGLVSIGQQAFLGLGGYALVAAGNVLGVNPFVAVPAAALTAAALALPLSAVAFRLRGGHFAIGTWVISDVLRLTIANLAPIVRDGMRLPAASLGPSCHRGERGGSERRLRRREWPPPRPERKLGSPPRVQGRIPGGPRRRRPCGV